MKLYQINIEGLSEQVAKCPVQEKHGSLIALLRIQVIRIICA